MCQRPALPEGVWPPGQEEVSEAPHQELTCQAESGPSWGAVLVLGGWGRSGPQEERVELCRVGEAVWAILTSQDLCSLLVGGCGLRRQSVSLSAGQAWVWPEEASG